MKTIVFCILQEPGHLIPSFKLARKLAEQGHRIVYSGEARYRNDIISQGFEFMLQVIKNESMLNAYKPNPATLFMADYRMIEKHIESPSIFMVKKLQEKYAVDCAVIDDLFVDYAMAFHAANIRVVVFNTYLYADKQKNIPPLSSTYIPKPGLLSQLYVELLWFKERIKKEVDHLGKMIQAQKIYHPIKKLADKTSFPVQERLSMDHTFWYGLKNYPRIIVCPKEFDFPGADFPNFYYQSFVDSKRETERFNWELIPDSKPLVYCSLGTQAYKNIDIARQFKKKVIGIFTRKTDYNLIISIGNQNTIEEYLPLTPNIFIFNSVPQIDVLKRAALMITHGGLGSVKECLFLGVPMLVYPINLQSDQNGNAARVTYHGLGKRGNIRKDSRKTIESKIVEIINNPVYKEKAREFSRIFINNENSNKAIQYIESLF